MVHTKKAVQDAILTLGTALKQKSSFEALITANTELPRLVELIAYQLFLKQFDSRSCSEELYIAYVIVLYYGKELTEKGFVTFEE